MFLSKEPKSFPSLYSSTIIIFFLVTFIFSCNTEGSPKLPRNEKFPALIVFGDSIVDPGNNNHVKTIVRSNFPPYGRDFFGGSSTGRFSNGMIPSDFIAQALGIKELLPAFLDPNLQPQDLVTGVSFGSGGAGYDPLTSKVVSVLSLSDQLELFKSYLEKINEAFGKERVSSILSKGVFLVCTGSNDVANTYYTFRNTHYDFDSYAELMVRSGSTFVQQLYKLGVKRMGVISLPPIGCVPSQRTLRGGLSRECSKEQNQIASIFNSKMSAELASLSGKHRDALFLYLDIYNPVLELIRNPTQYGFEEVNKGCCGTGIYESSVLCNSLSDAHTCTDASKYIFWDAFHPSEKTYKIISTLVAQQSLKYL